MSRMPPDFGALGFHLSGRLGFVNLYCWRRGPWRLSWYLRLTIGRRVVVRGGDYETGMRQGLLRRALTDVLWGLRRKQAADRLGPTGDGTPLS